MIFFLILIFQKSLTGLLSVIQHLQYSQNFLGCDFQYSDLKNNYKWNVKTGPQNRSSWSIDTKSSYTVQPFYPIATKWCLAIKIKFKQNYRLRNPAYFDICREYGILKIYACKICTAFSVKLEINVVFLTFFNKHGG